MNFFVLTYNIDKLEMLKHVYTNSLKKSPKAEIVICVLALLEGTFEYTTQVLSRKRAIHFENFIVLNIEDTDNQDV